MNLINLSKADLDRYIYRITKPEYVYSLFRTRQNVLVSPGSWDDPFENFVLKSMATLPSGERIEWGFKDDFFGQCWTLHSASDAMWRIYAKDKEGIRLRTTVRKAFEDLSRFAGINASHQAYVGKVRYLPARRLRTFARDAISMPFTPQGFASTLLVKRPAFRHEDEVRLLFLANETNARDETRLRYDVDPHSMIDQMMLDPWLSTSEAAALTATVRQNTGFKGPILRSLLYAPPDGFPFRIS
jgi:hypothetical protein